MSADASWPELFRGLFAVNDDSLGGVSGNNCFFMRARALYIGFYCRFIFGTQPLRFNWKLIGKRRSF